MAVEMADFCSGGFLRLLAVPPVSTDRCANPHSNRPLSHSVNGPEAGLLFVNGL
jgi:hypothetical protein